MGFRATVEMLADSGFDPRPYLLRQRFADFDLLARNPNLHVQRTIRSGRLGYHPFPAGPFKKGGGPYGASGLAIVNASYVYGGRSGKYQL